MKSLVAPKAKNRATLRKLARDYSTLLTDQNDMAAQYAQYLLSNGSPLHVTPLTGLQAPTIKRLEDRYGSPAKKHGLNWIKNLREDHGLAYCPMCGSPNVTTLEHYLPKAQYPEFYIFSYNLIPSCIACNQKRSHLANAHGTALPLLHPYFEGSLLDVGFLFTDIIARFDAPQFRPAINGQLTGIMRDRAQRHIEQSIKIKGFQAWATPLWEKWKRKAGRHQSLDSLLHEISTELIDTETTEGRNSWSASFLRGLLNNHAAANWLLNNSGQTAVTP